MKKYFLISLILHCLVALPLAIKKVQEQQQEQVKYEQGGQGTENKGGTTAQIIEIGEINPIAEKKELKNFYWGIGVYADPKFEGNYREVITGVVVGYSADTAGLLPGDEILEIDGKVMYGENSLRGDGPRKMILTIRRKSSIIYINIERVKVYY